MGRPFHQSHKPIPRLTLHCSPFIAQGLIPRPPSHSFTVLHTPSHSQGLITGDDGGASAMSRAADSDVGCLYIAHKGYGTYSAPLDDAYAPFTRIRVKDVTDFSEAQVTDRRLQRGFVILSWKWFASEAEPLSRILNP